MPNCKSVFQIETEDLRVNNLGCLQSPVKPTKFSNKNVE